MQRFVFKLFSGLISLFAMLPHSMAIAAPQPFAYGADLSLVTHLEKNGVKFRQDGQVLPGLQIFHNHGCNFARLRLFVDPDGTAAQVNTLAYTLDLAQQAEALGMRILLNFHYSDQWGDPNNQSIPKAWKDLPEEALRQRVRDYTRETLEAFRERGCLPQMVQIGNEINHGMMWPIGGPLHHENGGKKWIPLGHLLKAAAQGVRDADPDRTISIMVHPACGGHAEAAISFFDNVVAQSVPFDVIGLTYYPFWNGSIEDLTQTMHQLAERYKRPIYVVEVGKNWNGDEQSKPFPDTPLGQKEFLKAVIDALHGVPNNLGQGFFYWAADWVQSPKWLESPEKSKQWEERALFDFEGNALPALELFRGKNEKPNKPAATLTE